MAIFYKHIKGCGSGTASSDTGNWSWIVWSNEGKAPKIYTNINSNFNSSPTDLGSIITSDGSGQYFSKIMKFDQGLRTDSIFTTTSETKPTKISIASNNIEFYTSNDSKLQITDTLININTRVNAFSDMKFLKNLHVGDSAHTWGSSDKGNIKADNKCEALYFNAISDRRAKTNITPATFSALAAVNALPVYTFNYNTKPEELTIGLIAQEAAEHNLNNFNMVDNLDASGENNDFMQMKESKLVYVLWKAVQELSAEVESLKAQLNNK